MIRHEIKSISISSAFKIGIVFNALISAVFGGLVFLLQASIISAFSSIGSSLTVTGRPTDFDLTGLTLGALCFGWVIGIGIAAVIGGIAFAVGALVYNLTARFVGGLEYNVVVYSPQADPLAGQWELTNRAGY